MHRIEEVCSVTGEDETTVMKQFLTEWFHVKSTRETRTTKTIRSPMTKPLVTRATTSSTSLETPDMAYSPSSSPDNSDDESSEARSSTDDDSVQLYRQEMDRFFAWAFYGKFHSQLRPQELQELDRIYKELEDRHGLVFPFRESRHDESDTLQNTKFQPRCMTLEPVNAMYRPLLIYMIVYAMKIGGGIWLRIMGFQRMVASTGLVAWYRPGKNTTSSMLPMLFFHGIAPGGHILYLPMLLFGLAAEPERPVVLFENRSISCALDFLPLTEQQTVDGIVEVLKECDNLDQKDLSLVAHSFGSCLVTWVLASKRLPNIKHVALIDPVAILLSEPDVMVNFLYAEELDKIRMVASSELFTEYYLRRHFAWYNSELWLEDVDCPMLIGLSENDEIINATKVKQEIKRHAKSAKLVYWHGVGHGACVQSPTKWRHFKELMLEQELQIVQQMRQ
jgi:pimeloyl-ACP methyl ester carboxylesterase